MVVCGGGMASAVRKGAASALGESLFALLFAYAKVVELKKK